MYYIRFQTMKTQYHRMLGITSPIPPSTYNHTIHGRQDLPGAALCVPIRTHMTKHLLSGPCPCLPLLVPRLLALL